jgi:porin
VGRCEGILILIKKSAAIPGFIISIDSLLECDWVVIKIFGLLLFEVMANANRYFCGASVLNCTLAAILSFFEVFASSFVCAQPDDQGPKSSLIDLSSLGISGSPARVEAIPGTGELGEWLGIPADSAWRLGGIWLGNASAQLGGGLNVENDPGLAQQILLNLHLDLEKFVGWKGARVWVQALQVNANKASYRSGSLQGSNSTLTPPPFDRTELYDYAFAQSLFDDQATLLLGKLIPSIDFANVVIPISVNKKSLYSLPSITSLTYTPPYAMPTLLGRLPGYPNSALGASINLNPKLWNKSSYLKFGIFDGRGGSGISPAMQTGMALPSLSGPLFLIGELGSTWRIGSKLKPGAMGIGLWRQGGPLSICSEKSTASCLNETNAYGAYLIAQQRLINFRYPKDGSGISGFLQFGWSPANTNLFASSVGGGLSIFAPMKSRPLDSFGLGVSWAKINNQAFLYDQLNDSELMVQAYAQLHLAGNIYLTPSITVLPLVGKKEAAAPSTSALMQLVFLF